MCIAQKNNIVAKLIDLSLKHQSLLAFLSVYSDKHLVPLDQGSAFLFAFFQDFILTFTSFLQLSCHLTYLQFVLLDFILHVLLRAFDTCALELVREDCVLGPLLRDLSDILRHERFKSFFFFLFCLKELTIFLVQLGGIWTLTIAGCSTAFFYTSVRWQI